MIRALLQPLRFQYRLLLPLTYGASIASFPRTVQRTDRIYRPKVPIEKRNMSVSANTRQQFNQQFEVTSGATNAVWIHNDTYANRSGHNLKALAGDIEADVCIVGSGIAGVSIAYELVTRGKHVALLEARELLSGETGRTSGHLSNALDDGYLEIQKKHGTEGAKAAAESHTWALNYVGEVARKLGIDCEYRQVPGYTVSQYSRNDPKHADDMEEIKKEVQLAQQLGIDVEFNEGLQVKGWSSEPGRPDQRDGAVWRNQATFHPTKYVNGVLGFLLKQPNFKCFTQTRVMSVNEPGIEILGVGNKHVEVKTQHGHTVTCGYAVEATNVPLQKLSVVAEMEYDRTYCIAIRVPKGSVEDCLIYDTAEEYKYVRLTACDDSEDYLVVGGMDHKVGQENTGGRFDELETWTRERFPQAGAVDYMWSGQVFEPVDYMAFIGLNQACKRTFVVTGDSGNGLTHGVIAGRLIADEIDGQRNSWADLYSPKRKMSIIKSATTMIAHDMQINSQYKRFLQTDITDIEDLVPGSGGVMNSTTQKPIAVYKDENGNITKLVLLITILHYAYPAAVFIYYIASAAVTVCTLQSSADRPRHMYLGTLATLMVAFVFTFVVELGVLLTLSSLGGYLGQIRPDIVIGLLSSILTFGVLVADIFGTDAPMWRTYIGPYVLAALVEPLLATLNQVADSRSDWYWSEYTALGAVAVREVLAVSILVLYASGRPRVDAVSSPEDTESQPLLQKTDNTVIHGSSGHYGSTQTDNSNEVAQSGAQQIGDRSTIKAKAKSKDNGESHYERRRREARERMEKRLRQEGNWFLYMKSFAVFLPYIWPGKNRVLQLHAVLVGGCLFANNALNVLIPRQMGVLTDSLSGANDENPWVQVGIFAVLRLTASEAGLSLARQWLWIPIENYSTTTLSSAAYSHVLNLSADFHDSKGISELSMAIQSGQSLTGLLDSICFHALPMMIDLCLAFVYLSTTFGPYEGLITVATAVIFFHVATRMLAKLREPRKSEVSAWFHEHYVLQAGIQGWSTVTCFNQVPYEENRYSEAINDRVAKSETVFVGYLFAYAFQYLVLLAGLLAGSFLAVHQVASKQATAGQFVMLLTYWGQLVSPLNYFAGLGKTISRNLVQAEQLLEIMQKKPTVLSKDGAPALELSGARVKFDSVGFSYDGKKKILNNVSFDAPPGTTVAFVGATGAGKSTILKLLGRFYDVNEGSITIDGQDIRDVDQCSLRDQIGIVPQSPVLFDDTIMNNVRYARLSATDDEVFDACKAACVHDQVMGFTDGYETRVGERGVKVSGGELQRLAIARAILKQPSIVLLDEATSSVDTETEQKIQDAFGSLCAGRTTFIVAHRLSTVMNAHVIMVVSGGEIIEQGSHDMLIAKGGKYSELWSKQFFVKPKPRLSVDLDPADGIHATPQRHVVEKSKGKANGNSSSQDGSDDTAVHTPSGHRREGSKLNPDAPTFTPRATDAHTCWSKSREAADNSLSNEDQNTIPGKQPLQEQGSNQEPTENGGGPSQL
ncbi:hypothetical protein PpBr36_00114 [Pyricularia pennisetigena]|uniref:hypothetical protein n=1 Tax=Pyricularia pennisetigena TaxID=1578925 RepID=UPI0011531BC4|nr:hypothetical protein PpBr36_00114 [Pyricularia pennisetigena]TLS28063.1 hypothetical protein PpBr36_00114 [Pyricularia pennisetigena]